MASSTRWTWVWVNSGSWWWTGRPGVLRFMGLQRVRHDWVTELNWILSNRLPRWHSGKESACQPKRCKRCRFNPWIRKISWRRAWQPTPVFLPGKSHGQRSMAGYSPWVAKELEMIYWLNNNNSMRLQPLKVPGLERKLVFNPLVRWPLNSMACFTTIKTETKVPQDY